MWATFECMTYREYEVRRKAGSCGAIFECVTHREYEVRQESWIMWGYI